MPGEVITVHQIRQPPRSKLQCCTAARCPDIVFLFNIWIEKAGKRMCISPFLLRRPSSLQVMHLSPILKIGLHIRSQVSVDCTSSFCNNTAEISALFYPLLEIGTWVWRIAFALASPSRYWLYSARPWRFVLPLLTAAFHVTKPLLYNHLMVLTRLPFTLHDGLTCKLQLPSPLHWLFAKMPVPAYNHHLSHLITQHPRRPRGTWKFWIQPGGTFFSN